MGRLMNIEVKTGTKCVCCMRCCTDDAQVSKVNLGGLDIGMLHNLFSNNIYYFILFYIQFSPKHRYNLMRGEY